MTHPLLEFLKMPLNTTQTFSHQDVMEKKDWQAEAVRLKKENEVLKDRIGELLATIQILREEGKRS